jgi:hypothetical protein
MAKVLPVRSLPDREVRIPGLKPAVRDFVPSDDADPAEVDAFNSMIRKLRDRNPAPLPHQK